MRARFFFASAVFLLPLRAVADVAVEDYDVFHKRGLQYMREEKWNLAPLTHRDAAAVSPLGALDLDAPPAFLAPPDLSAPKAGAFRPSLTRRAARRAEGRLARPREEDRPAARLSRPGYPNRKSAQRSPIMMLGAFVLPEVTAGMTEASATRRPSTP